MEHRRDHEAVPPQEGEGGPASRRKPVLGMEVIEDGPPLSTEPAPAQNAPVPQSPPPPPRPAPPPAGRATPVSDRRSSAAGCAGLPARCEAKASDPRPRSVEERGRIALVALIGATLLLVFLEKQLIYYPAAGLDVTPRPRPALRDVLLDVEPGVTVHAWFIGAAKQPTPLSSLHGSAGNIADRLDRVLRWRGLDADFLLYDYRAMAAAQPSRRRGHVSGRRAAYDYLVKSRGAGPQAPHPDGRVARLRDLHPDGDRAAGRGSRHRGSLASIPHMANAIYPFLPLGPFIKTRYLNVEKISRLRMPSLVVQGTRDEVIPVARGRWCSTPHPA